MYQLFFDTRSLLMGMQIPIGQELSQRRERSNPNTVPFQWALGPRFKDVHRNQWLLRIKE